tara:strand:+ start:577 stop:1152 length:576 start_codon:yes stop_codon:yes gene_type:complete
MKLLNDYNILDQFIAYLRNKELLKNSRIKGKKIIDFGCGSNFQDMEKRYKDAQQVILIDRWGKNFSKKNVTFINYKDKLTNIDHELKEEKFDIIILAAVIEHLDKPENVIMHMKKFLNNDGYFLLTAPSVHSKWLIEFLAFKLGVINADLVREHKRYYNKKEYETLSAKSGCELEEFYFFELGMNTAAILK